MKSKYVTGTINKDIYIHQDADTIKRVDELEKEIVLKQDKLTAGENITISEDNVISSVGGGAEVFVIHIADGDVSTITVTKEEVIAAIESNQTIVIDYEKTNTYGLPSTHYITAPVAVMTSQFLSHEYELEGRVANPVDSEYRFYSISFSDMAGFSFNERFIQSVSTVNSESTNQQTPTAKAVYDAIIENSPDSIYETTVYYNDTATFDEHGETSLGECGIPLDISELKVTIDGTEHTLYRHDDGEYIWWANDDESLSVWNENGNYYLESTSTTSQDCAVKVEGKVLTQEFTNAVNDAVTYYDVYLDNQVVTFNEQGVADLGSFNLNPEQTPKLLMTIDGAQELVYTWNGDEYTNEEDGTVISEEDGAWFWVTQGAGGSISISLSSADVKSDFKDAVLSVSNGSVEIFDVTYQQPKSNIQGLYTLMDGKTIFDIYNAYGSGKTVLIRYNRQNDASIKLLVPSNTVVIWTVESIYISSNNSYTIITNAVKFIDDDNEYYVRLKCDSAYSDSNQFTGYSEESGSSNVSFVLTSAAPKGQLAEEPTSWYLTDNKTFEDVYNAFINDEAVYLITTYNQFHNAYQVTSALHDGGSSKGPYDSYTIYAEAFAGIDANGNVQMKYLQVEQGYDGTGTPFTLYNKTISNGGGVETISYGAADADEICTLLDSGKEVKVSHNGLIYDLHSLYGSDKYKSSIVNYGVQPDTDVPFIAWKVDRIANDYSQIKIDYSCYLTQSAIDDEFGCVYGQIGVWLILNNEDNSVIKDTLYNTLINIPSDTKSGIIESKMSPYAEVTAQITGPLSGGQYFEVNAADFNFHNEYGFYIVFALLDSKVSGMSYIANIGGITGYDGTDWDSVVSRVEPGSGSNAIVLHGLQAMISQPGHTDCWYSNSNEVFQNLTLNTDPAKDFNYIDMVNPSQAEIKWVKFRQTSDNSFRSITVEDGEWSDSEIKIVDLVPPELTITTFDATYDSNSETYVLNGDKTIQDLYDSIKNDTQTFVVVHDGFNVNKFQMGNADMHFSLGGNTFSVSGYCLDAQNPNGLTANCIYAYKVSADSTALHMTSQYIGITIDV